MLPHRNDTQITSQNHQTITSKSETTLNPSFISFYNPNYHEILASLFPCYTRCVLSQDNITIPIPNPSEAFSHTTTTAVAASLRGAHILNPRHLETVEETLISEVILSSNDGLELTRTADILQGTTQLVCQLEDLQAEVEGSTQLVVTVENTEGTGFITVRFNSE